MVTAAHTQPMSSPQQPVADPIEEIDTRFGKVTLDRSQPIIFSQGLLGMPDKFHFVFAEFPVRKYPQFRLMQCLDDLELSFITLPIETSNILLAKEDIADSAGELGIPMDALSLSLIVSVHRLGEHVQLSVNARAPLFINNRTRQAVQHVFTMDRYRVQHMISASPVTPVV
jgi:flagellar assembly factor FliW